MKHTVKKFLFILITLFSTAVTLFSQQPVEVKVSENKVILEGHIYYIHVVKPGQTLYSISKAYKVRDKDIALENPGVYSGLQVGQVLKIPADVPVFDENENQPRVIDTLRFIPHYLVEGETVYSLSRRYNLPVSEMEKANPGLDYTDLEIGQLILIPRMKITKEEDTYILHKVRRRETLFSLSRQYNLDKSVILQHNPDIGMGGLKTGQIVRIPRQLEPEKEAEIAMVQDDLDSLELEMMVAFDENLKPLEEEDYYREMNDMDRSRLKVAFLVPFDYFEEQEPDTILTDEEGMEVEVEDDKEDNRPRSVNFLEFFEGSMMALDKLRSEGYSLDVQYYDTRKSPSRLREIFATPGFNETDLIIGPFYAWNVEIASVFSREYGIPLVSPFYENAELTARNPFLFQLNPGYKVEYRTAARILAKEYDKNFIFVYSNDSLKMHEIEYFKSSLLGAASNYTHEENFIIKELVYENAGATNLVEDLKLAMTTDKTNIVVIPESNQAFVSNMITQLYFQLMEYDIEVFGLPHFAGYANIDYKYFHALKLRYVSPYYYSYSDTAILRFLAEYRNLYRSEPSISTRKGYPYAFAGYDVTYFFIHKMAEYGKRFVRRINYHDNDLLIPYYWRRQSLYGGFENQHLSLVEFGDNYSFKVRDVSGLPYERIERRTPWYFRNDD